MLTGVLILLFTGGIKAQSGYYFYDGDYYQGRLQLEGGLTAGVLNCLTDVGGSKRGQRLSGAVNDFTFRHTDLNGGLYLLATLDERIGLKLEANYGTLQAADSSLKGTTNKFAEGRYVRNLSFKTRIFEAALNFEIHPLMFRDYTEKEPPRLSPYATLGFGWIWFNPKAQLNGVWYDLEPLRLEGQGFAEYPDRKRYKRNCFEIPFGVGLRYELSANSYLRLEGQYHYIFTDYLDDVSYGDWVDPALFYKYLSPSQAAVATQLYNRSTVINPPRNTRPRGFHQNKDAYWNVAIKFGIILNRNRANNSFEFR